MAYTVAYQGALSPDRVIKHNLIHYLLRGPLVATAVGLAVAIPAVVFNNFFQRHIKWTLANTEALTRVLLSYLKAAPGTGPSATSHEVADASAHAPDRKPGHADAPKAAAKGAKAKADAPASRRSEKKDAEGTDEEAS